MWPGKTAIYKRLLCLLSITAFLGIFLLSPHPAEAALLLGPSDYFNENRINETNVIHNVSFVIPTTGHTIVPSDYIRIIFTNYSAVTAPTSGSGWSGSPTYGVTGNVAYVTNVSANPGQGIGISGITATNPGDPADYDITIEIANDISGSIVYDSATFDPEMKSGVSVTTVTISGTTASIEIFGFTSPSAFVTIMLNGGVAGTTSADGNGNFHHKITGLNDDENYSVSIFAQDTQLRQTQTVSFIVHTLPFTNHILNNITLPTTIEIDKTTIYQGDLLGIFGRGHPLSQITVWVNSGPPYTQVISANAQGYWDYDFDSLVNELNTGTHHTYAKEVVTGGFESIFTQSLPFIANKCIPPDINCDGFVNLTDFSIMLFYWNQTNPANPRADINHDSVVNLTDFSVMLFYWTG